MATMNNTPIELQIQEAKNQALSGMAQLGVGRKLLHKHDDEDEQQKKERKAAKKEKKLKEKLMDEAEDFDGDDEDEVWHFLA